MSNETTITIAGNLIDDPDLRFTPAGQPFARFRIASTPRYRDGATGEWKDGDTVFLTYVAWRLLAENIAESLEKGMRVIRHRSPPAALIRGPGRRQAHRVRAPCRRGGPGAEQGHGQGRQVQPLRQRPARGPREVSRDEGERRLPPAAAPDDPGGHDGDHSSQPAGRR
jgi:hypothetical protein